MFKNMFNLWLGQSACCNETDRVFEESENDITSSVLTDACLDKTERGLLKQEEETIRMGGERVQEKEKDRKRDAYGERGEDGEESPAW